jgi:hypothetical protein
MEHWKSHFRLMAQGKVHPDHNGVFVVKKSSRQHEEDRPEVKVNVISPTEQTVDQAKAIIHEEPKRKKRKTIRGSLGRPPGRTTLW